MQVSQCLESGNQDSTNPCHSSCSGSIRAAVSELEGVKTISVSLLGNSMEVVHDPFVASESQIMDAVGDCSYKAVVWKKEVVASKEEVTEETDIRTVQLLIEGECEYVECLRCCFSSAIR